MYHKELSKLNFGLYGPFKVIEKLKEDEPLLRIKPILKQVQGDELTERLETKMGAYYSPNEGRPAYPIKKSLGMILIQHLYSIHSDRIIRRLCLTDALFRHFIGCHSFEDLIPDDTTLGKFRKRLGEEGFREIFDELVKLALEAGQITPFRIIDATHINAIGKKLGVIKFITEGIKRVIKEMLMKNEEFAKRLKEEFQSLKIKTKRSARKIGKRFIKEVSKLKEMSQKARKVIEAMELSLAGEPMVNYTDTEARWGYKRDDFTFGGYKGEILPTEKGFVTGFRVLSGNRNEGKDISPLIEEEKRRGIKPKEAVEDRLYPSAKNFKYLNKEKNNGVKSDFFSLEFRAKIKMKK
ncbi:MAG: transposase [bacterium]|nr:transposase [bacterium]